MTPRRVLLVLGPSSGGIRRHVAILRDGLAERGWEPMTAAPAGVLDGLGGADVVLPVGLDPRTIARGAGILRRASTEVDLVHAHGMKAAAVAVAARCRPRVMTLHNVVLDDAAGRSAPVLRAVERRLPGAMDRTIAVSNEIRGRFPAAARAAMEVIVPAGTPPVPERTADEVRADLGVGDRPLVVTAARLHPQKDLGALLRAAVDVRAEVADVAVVIVGDGPDRRALEDLRDDLGLAGTVSFTGQVPNAADHLAAADVVAQSSLWEGSPLVVAEAMTLGRPVVATAVGANPEAIEDGVTGVLVEPRAPAALGAAIVEVLGDPAHAAAMGAAARVAAGERFAPGVLIDAVVRCYERVVQEARR